MTDPTDTDETIFTADESRRNELFVEMKQRGEHMIHRLRDWQVGQIVWGYDLHRENGSSTGKTFTRGGASSEDILRDERGHEQAKEMYETRTEQIQSGAAFYWVGRITRVRVEGRNPADPGEPPLKFAELEQVKVLDSTCVPEVDE